jgi:hypothetical protein
VDQAIYVCPLKFVVVEEDKTLWRPTASPLFFPPRAHTIRIVRASARAIPAPPRSDSSEFLLPMASSGIRILAPCEFVDSCGEFCYYYTSLLFFPPKETNFIPYPIRRDGFPSSGEHEGLPESRAPAPRGDEEAFTQSPLLSKQIRIFPLAPSALADPPLD